MRRSSVLLFITHLLLDAEADNQLEGACSGDHCEFDELIYMQSPHGTTLRRIPSMDAESAESADVGRADAAWTLNTLESSSERTIAQLEVNVASAGWIPASASHFIVAFFVILAVGAAGQFLWCCYRSRSSSAPISRADAIAQLKCLQKQKWACIGVMMTFLLSTGVVVGMLWEGWNFMSSFYFICQIVTTVGYGDLTVEDDLMKCFCAVYALCCIVVIGYVVGVFTQHLHERQSEAVRHNLHRLQAMVSSADLSSFQSMVTSVNFASEHPSMMKRVEEMRAQYGHCASLFAATFIMLCFVLFGTVFYATYEACSCSFGKTAVDGCREDNYDTCVTTGGYVKTWPSAFYMSVMTLTTVGFGDHCPRSHLGRSVGAFWMVFGVASMVNFVKCLSEYFFELGANRDLELDEEINDETFHAMDKDRSGHLSRAEYRGYILVKHGLVKQEDLDIIDRHYDMLDEDKSEQVTLEMIKRAQQRG
eukprot:gnl/TRDRNA2_/TRDRNA2_39990_c0_seq1.p1 gnl/TRDRNA2_/TRDRNA2_39990_c0~~gnl/TRDRNA2_/TRDRNA2_39990_c0_seq1.p1  ORF type:complete len:478 (+),score=78.36 gnl/TRDRNA2_/TRDRNA2_39990_c0_seq1:93-1526(+)